MQMIKKFNRLTDVMCLLFCRDDRDPVDLSDVVRSGVLFLIFIIVLGFYYGDFIVLFYLVFYYDLIVVSYLIFYYLLYET
jgi:hypothetical protein